MASSTLARGVEVLLDEAFATPEAGVARAVGEEPRDDEVRFRDHFVLVDDHAAGPDDHDPALGVERHGGGAVILEVDVERDRPVAPERGVERAVGVEAREDEVVIARDQAVPDEDELAVRLHRHIGDLREIGDRDGVGVLHVARVCRDVHLEGVVDEVAAAVGRTDGDVGQAGLARAVLEHELAALDARGDQGRVVAGDGELQNAVAARPAGIQGKLADLRDEHRVLGRDRTEPGVVDEGQGSERIVELERGYPCDVVDHPEVARHDPPEHRRTVRVERRVVPQVKEPLAREAPGLSVSFTIAMVPRTFEKTGSTATGGSTRM